MKRASMFALMLAVISAASACASRPPARSAMTSPHQRHAETRSVAAIAPPVLEHTTVSGPTVFHLRAARFANLFYHVDCLAGTTRCSRVAYEDLWTRTLGGLDAEDRAALARWKVLRDRYGGRISREDETSDAELPVRRPARNIESRLRLAGYTAMNVAEYGERLSLFADPADVVEAVAIVNRFVPRFDAWWPSQGASLARSIEGYATLFARSDVQTAISEIARFYRSELPAGYAMEIDLVARPDHRSNTSGELVGLRSVVEVVDGEPPEERFPIILHEIFHGWFASGGDKSAVALTQRVAASTDPDAVAAYSLLDEGLATANGNGKIARIVQPRKYAERIAIPRGLYDDPYVDGIAKALLVAMDARLPGMDSVFADGFVSQYLTSFHSAFPRGLPPIGRLKAYVCLYDTTVRGSYDRLSDHAHVSNMYSDSTLDRKAAGETLDKRGRWPLVLMVPFAKLDSLRAWSAEIDTATLAKITQQARAGKPFVVASRRLPLSDLYVFAAPDDAAMLRIVEIFAARETSFDVLVADVK